MSSLRVWSIIVILYQTIICLIISWFTLECRFAPTSSELHEVTLLKLVYLYDPEACGRVHFYNVTLKHHTESYSTIMWPVTNALAASFRSKIRLWLCLHVLWFGLAIANMTHGQRHCGFYAVVVPFTIAGIALLIVDLIYTGLFVQNIPHTNTQLSILNFMNTSSPGSIKWISTPFSLPSQFECDEDTSWISLLVAYSSCRGVVQWIINFWLVKDNYFEGLEVYRMYIFKNSTTVPTFNLWHMVGFIRDRGILSASKGEIAAEIKGVTIYNQSLIPFVRDVTREGTKGMETLKHYFIYKRVIL